MHGPVEIKAKACRWQGMSEPWNCGLCFRLTHGMCEEVWGCGGIQLGRYRSQTCIHRMSTLPEPLIWDCSFLFAYLMSEENEVQKGGVTS